jgi:RNA polymerase sigma factor (sigma-70 family)
MRLSDNSARPHVSTKPTTASSQQWSEFFQKNSKPLRKIIAQKADLQTHDQDDAFGDTLLGMAKVLARGDSPRAPFSFVSAIAIKKVCSKLRQVASVRQRADQPLSDALEDPTRRGLDALLAQERWQAVRSYLVSIDPTDRDILVAHDIDDLTFDEIADRVGMAKTTVHRRYDAAVQRAKQQLAYWAL